LENFSLKLKNFILNSQNDLSKIKEEYLKLVKEFHPDLNKKEDFNKTNEYMMQLNYVYGELITKKTVSRKQENDYEGNKENGKYWYINDYGRKEYVKEKTLYIYKLALLELQKCYKIMQKKSVFDGNREESGYEVIKHLYECYLLLKEQLKMENNDYRNIAEALMRKAYRMNKRISNGLQKSNEKGLVLRSP